MENHVVYFVEKTTKVKGIPVVNVSCIVYVECFATLPKHVKGRFIYYYDNLVHGAFSDSTKEVVVEQFNEYLKTISKRYCIDSDTLLEQFEDFYFNQIQ